MRAALNCDKKRKERRRVTFRNISIFHKQRERERGGVTSKFLWPVSNPEGKMDRRSHQPGLPCQNCGWKEK